MNEMCPIVLLIPAITFALMLIPIAKIHFADIKIWELLKEIDLNVRKPRIIYPILVSCITLFISFSFFKGSLTAKCPDSNKKMACLKTGWMK